MSISSFLFGKDPKMEQLPAMTPQQTQLLSQLMGGLGAPTQQMMGQLSQLLSGSPEAMEAFQLVIRDFRFGQAWDTNGWFWKPAEAAKEKLAMLDSGTFYDFGDYSSSYLTTQAWKALAEADPKVVDVYADKVISLYEDKAREMQESLSEYPWQSREHIFKYWALNDVGTVYFIKAEAYKKAGLTQEAREAYKKIHQ